MKKRIAAAAFAILCTAPAYGGKLEDSFEKLPPEEQARQACILKGVGLIRKDKRVARADRVKTSISGKASFDGTLVATKGGAVRSDKRWYHLKFNCTVTADLKKATSFDFELGDEIPEDQWEDLGLWK